MRLYLYLAALSIISVLVVSGCLQSSGITGKVIDTGDNVTANECPESCSDGNLCTTDFCSEETGFSCRYLPVSDKPCGEDMFCEDGVCQSPEDECSYMFGRGLLTAREVAEEADCYRTTYNVPAVESGDPIICNDIVKPVFLAKCYAAVALDANELDMCDFAMDASVSDDCYIAYASSMSESFIFEGEACNRIRDYDKKSECNGLEDAVTAPVGIKDFHAVIVGSEIHSYIVLKDIRGRTTVGDGTLTVYIKQEDAKGEEDKRLYFKKIDVKKQDFRQTALSGFGSKDIAYVIPVVSADDMLEYPSENFGTFYITFLTSDGKSFFQSKELEF
jgi:hypothetical protein